ncbi:uncharacterized protein LOC143049618 isoform X1 [Mytilus galloprovincialis]|uniref:uncharacterized protein LOC143049618 isoform X1 n=1 Tax=Mytilus galloprovincialis TaxID=29158 RepID=UPI003F7C06A1
MNIKIAGIFNILALLLLVAGALAPGWIVIESSGNSIHVGLFYTVANGSTGRSLSFFGLIEFQIEVIVGIILCIIATILIFVYANGQKGHSYLMSSVILNLISGVITCVAVGRFLHAILRSLGYNMGVPYSLILSGLGAVMLFVIIVVLIVKKTQDSNRIQSSQGIVLATTSKPQVNMGYSQDPTQQYGIPPKYGV